MKLLFQGDSITDAGRNYLDRNDLGHGYPQHLDKMLQEAFPEMEFECLNLGVSGTEVGELLERADTDVVAVQPDIMTLMIGINDVLHCLEQNRPWLSNEVFEQQYRSLLETVKNKTHAKLLVIEPYLTPNEDKQAMRGDLDEKIQIIRRLAREYADGYVPTDGLLASVFIHYDHAVYSPDGIHPTDGTAHVLAEVIFPYLKKLIAE